MVSLSLIRRGCDYFAQSLLSRLAFFVWRFMRKILFKNIENITYWCFRLYCTIPVRITIASMVQQQNAMARPIVPSFDPKSTNLAAVAAGEPTNQNYFNLCSIQKYLQNFSVWLISFETSAKLMNSILMKRHTSVSAKCLRNLKWEVIDHRNVSFFFNLSFHSLAYVILQSREA